MVKHKFLRDVRFDKGLKLAGGFFAHNYRELLAALKLMDDSEFNTHLSNKDYFVDWIRENYGDKELAEKLKSAKSRKKYLSILEKRIVKLEREAKELSGLIEQRERIKRRKSQIFPYVWFAVYGVLIAFLFLQQIYYSTVLDEMSSELSVKSTSLLDAIDRNALLEGEVSVLESEKKALQSLNSDLIERNLVLATQVDSFYSSVSPGPRDRVPEESIVLDSGSVKILVDNPFISRFTDTRSMLPVLNTGANAIQVVPENYSDIFVGDIVSYESSDGRTVIHRVVETGFDEDGWYAVMKGDSVRNPDPGKVRFEHVRRVLIAIIY